MTLSHRFGGKRMNGHSNHEVHESDSCDPERLIRITGASML
jgi:hypothetical protein